jgi:dihydrofolate synthase/folylpolyglutamate synthase
MGFNEAVQYIYSLTNLEVSRDKKIPESGIENVKKVLEYLKIDFLSIPTFHIAGTKGKGTVSTIVAYLLSKKSGSVGLFTSPHLLSITERISILNNGEVFFITQEEFEDIYLEVRGAKEKLNIELTTFDFLTVMAMVYFVSKKVDYIVLEVGLGGRLDSTNFCMPKVCGITLIDYDHTKILGDTLEKIAYEKCGIIKNGIPVVSMYQKESVREVISSVAKEKGSNLTFIDNLYKVEEVKVSKDGTFAKVRNLVDNKVFDIGTSLIGEHFIWNILMAFEMIQKVLLLEYSLLNDVNPPIGGRFEVIKREPFVVFDVAHTPLSIEKSILTFISLASTPRVLAISILKDKEIDKISKVLSNFEKEFKEIYILKIDDSNDGSEILKEKLKSLGIESSVIDDVHSLPEADTLFVGSFRSYGLVKGGVASF